MWQSIFGSFTACHTVASHPLWYAHYDDKQTFSDFAAFGGWTKPHMKQYKGDTTLCGAGVDKNYVAWMQQSLCSYFILNHFYLFTQTIIN